MTVSVEISNLGPVRSARAEASALTLLVGANNTGKTAFATVLHRVLGGSPYYPLLWQSPMRSHRTPIPDEVREWIEKVIEYSDEEALDQLQPLAPSSSTIEWATEFMTDSLRGFAVHLREQLEYAFGVDAFDLCRVTESGTTSDCFVRVHNSHPNWRVTIRFDSEDIKIEPPDPLPWLDGILETTRIVDAYQNYIRRRGYRAVREIEGTPLNTRPFRTQWNLALYESWPRQGVHLPAGRTGIIHSHQILTGTIVRRSAGAGIEPIRMDPFPGTIADLLSLLVEVTSRASRYKLRKKTLDLPVQRFEKQLGVSIEIEEEGNLGHLIVAKTREGVFPMSRASSMNSELAPIIVALKYWLRQGDYVTLDEPEAHLHPKVQRDMATLLMDIIDCDISVIATTHSDFLLGEVNNLIRKGRLKAQETVAVEDSSGESSRHSVSALLFEPTTDGCVGRPLVVDPIEGIDESTFSDVTYSLYQESARLINSLQ